MSRLAGAAARQAIIYDPRRRSWQRHSNALDSWRAQSPDEVPALLAAVESAAADGRTAIGFVAYEAASAFDASLPGGTGDLARFAVFAESEDIEPPYPQALSTPRSQLTPVSGSDAYTSGIKRIKDYLAAGDSYQVNYTLALKGQLQEAPEWWFWQLFHQQPGDYATYLEYADMALCSVSPELFFRLDGTRIFTEPMKGTRAREPDPAKDHGIAAELGSSSKDCAENIMIVDMIRNDLSRIAATGSVRTDDLLQVRKLPSVWQMVSRVSATTEASLSDIFTALFPCASITGAPKRRSMEIINELEPTPRGVYTGAIGWVSANRQACFNVAIRTLCYPQDGSATYGTGCGIVWDSEPGFEWQEANDKSAILTRELPEFSLLETLCIRSNGDIVLLNLHLARLQRSAAYFGFCFDREAVLAALAEQRADSDLRVRLLCHKDGTLTVQQSPLTPVASPVSLRLATFPVSRHDVFLQHKTTFRKVYDDARHGLAGCDDVILFNESDELTETTIYNLFLQMGGDLLTPSCSAGLLPGTLRASLLEAGKVREAILTRDDLQRADEVWVGNSVRGLLPAQVLQD